MIIKRLGTGFVAILCRDNTMGMGTTRCKALGNLIYNMQQSNG